MKLNHKKLFILFIPFLFSSCTSTIPDIMATYITADIQQYYIRQEIIKKNPIDSMFDFTIFLENGQITQDIVVNYSIAVKDFIPSELENIKVSFLNGDEEFSLVFNSIIFKDPQNQEVRISATLTPAQFIQLIQSDKATSVRFTHPALETTIISSKGLIQKLSEARFLL